MASHQPRKRKDKLKDDTAHQTTQQRKQQPRNPSSTAPSASSPKTASSPQQQQKPIFPLAAFLWPVRHGTSQWIILPLVLMIVGLYRWAAGFWPYSGFKAPPMHGDFEAQRHWMELTLHLPITQWYFHDLDWWGLDYPPLTAYHSWFIGHIGALIDPRWFSLHSSRGLDDPHLKIFMRASVLISEYLTYIPAVVLFVRYFARYQRVSAWEASIALVAILMQPSVILIDHAHFQYNTVMLGFLAAAAACALRKRFLWASLFFVSALCFKQMALYYAPVIFSYFLGSCLFPRLHLGRFLGIATVTIASFAIFFMPFIAAAVFNWVRGRHSSEADLVAPLALISKLHLSTNNILYGPLLQLAQAVHRIFPLARGIFEDKVANFWCALNTFYKLRAFPAARLQQLSLAATLLAVLPPSLASFLYPRPALILPALATSAWAFFLFSFQVHEKSVLLPLFPMILLLAGESGLEFHTRAWITLANILGSWTMFPLLKRDGLTIPYFVLTLFWAWLMGAHGMVLSTSDGNNRTEDIFVRLLHGFFYLVMLLWHLAEAYVPPPPGKPDLWVVVNVLIGAAGFGICYLWCLWRVWSSIPAVRNVTSPSSKKSR